MPSKKYFLLFFLTLITTIFFINESSFFLFKCSSVYARNVLYEKNKNTNIDANKTGNVQILLDHDYYNTLLNDLSDAQKSIIIIMYVFKITGYKSALPDHIIDMLIKKHAQGVSVSVILNVDQKVKMDATNDDLNQTNLEVVKLLQSKGITVYLDSPKRTTHAKIVVIDNRIVYIGSHNFTQSALKYNHEASVKIISPEIAERIMRYMEELKYEK